MNYWLSWELTRKRTPRNARNHRLVCYCSGWWFPHRIYSKASPELQRTHGTTGCIHAEENDPMQKLKDIIKTAQRAGWRVQQGAPEHWRFYSPDGKHIVTTSSTPSDHRALKNIRSDLRRAGLALD